MVANASFDETIQITLGAGETEELFLDLEMYTKFKMAVILTDEEENINMVALGPNKWGHNSIIYEEFSKNYLYYEHEAQLKGEYRIQITNIGSKEIELIVLLNEHSNKKKDNIDTQKIDKISLFLNNIDDNINQLRTKKRIEIRQINKHNQKVEKYNRSIVIFSVVEIFTMIIVFAAQNYYISSIVSKL